MRMEFKKAKTALKTSKMQDYHKILNIPRDCFELMLRKPIVAS